MTASPRILTLAILATLATPSGAVHLSSDGTGQALIYPYYTVRDGHFTSLSVVNEGLDAKVLKVKFMESRNGREVLDFNLFLSPRDTWTAAVVATAQGARLVTNDNSCVVPVDLFTETRADALGLPLNEFKNYAYTGIRADNGFFAGLDRTREGYFEILEMGVIDADAAEGNAQPFPGTAAVVVSHLQPGPTTGVPANCAALSSLDNFPGNSSPTRFPNIGTTGTLTQPPRGGLAGRASIINAATGANYTYPAVALDAWSASVAYAPAGDITLTLAAANPPVSMVAQPRGTMVSTWQNGRDAVSAALMRDSVRNEFILDTGTLSLTDWVLTFPTKRFYVGVGDGPAQQPFLNNFANINGETACDPTLLAVYDRESMGESFEGPNAGMVVCSMSQVIPFGLTGLLRSRAGRPLTAAGQSRANGASTQPGPNTTPSIRDRQGPNGPMSLRFIREHQRLIPVSTFLHPAGAPSSTVTLSGSYIGLPVVGFMVHNYRNTGVASMYGGVIEHHYSRRFDTP